MTEATSVARWTAPRRSDCFRSRSVVVHPVPKELEEVPLPSAIDDCAVSGAALQLTGVGKTFNGKSGPTEALREVDLSIPEGEFVTILGRRVESSPRC